MNPTFLTKVKLQGWQVHKHKEKPLWMTLKPLKNNTLDLEIMILLLVVPSIGQLQLANSENLLANH